MIGKLPGIGNFALVSGLPITALRHYDEVGLLRPAWVDPVSGYRRYRGDQAPAARLLAVLRRHEVPIETMRAAPEDKPWKPRSTCVADPGGNNIDLYQA